MTTHNQVDAIQRAETGVAPSKSIVPSSGPEQRVAIIGAGAAGICAAKHLLNAGFSNIVVFEKGSHIGGMWVYQNDSGTSSAYKSLHINSPKNLTSFPDFPFDDAVQRFPSHEDMAKYLRAYAENFGVVPLIRFNSNVVSVQPQVDDGGNSITWQVEVEGEEPQLFDSVIVASGHLSKPLHVPEFREFGGEYLHSHYYREPTPYADQRVCVIGVGNSAVDIASDICVSTEQTTLVARSGVTIAPKMIFGTPFPDISMRFFRPWIPGFLRKWVLSTLIHIAHGRMTDYGFLPETKRVHPTSSATVINHIAYDRVVVKQGIRGIDGRVITFVDGTREEFDALIACTGYLIDLPFLPSDVAPIQGNSVSLYKRIVEPDWPGIYFMGMVNSTTSLNLNFEHQAKWLIAHMLGNAEFPSPAEMRRDIQAKSDYIQRHYKHSPRHTIEEEHLQYFSELARSLKSNVARARSGRSRTPASMGLVNKVRR